MTAMPDTAAIAAVNRGLFAVVAAMALATLAVPWLVPTSVEFARGDDAVRVPEVADPGPRRLAVRAPSRNPFDRTGARWEAPDDTGQTAATKPAPDDANASGVIRIGPLRGVFTPDGFVAVGDSLGPGRLKEVAPGRIVVETPEGERVLPLDGSRAQRLERLREGR